MCVCVDYQQISIRKLSIPTTTTATTRRSEWALCDKCGLFFYEKIRIFVWKECSTTINIELYFDFENVWECLTAFIYCYACVYTISRIMDLIFGWRRIGIFKTECMPSTPNQIESKCIFERTKINI